MWVFTEMADWFDRTRRANESQIDAWLQPWVATTLQDDSPWYRNAAIYTAAGGAYAVNKLSTTVAAGFVDVLRIGDGVQKGGWGLGEDALRLLVVAGPLLRVGRYGLSVVAAVDELSAANNCTWVAATRALRLTGTKHYSRLGDLAKAAGVAVADTDRAWVSELVQPLRTLGADVKQIGTLSSIDEVANVARLNPNGVVMFSVEFETASGLKDGHTLLATRGPGGVLRIIDKNGDVFSSLAEWTRVRAVTNTVVYGNGAVVQNARAVTLLNNAPSLLNIMALEVRSVPVQIPQLDAPVVLKTDTQLLEGWWWVSVDKWIWTYDFDAHGGVRWTDPYNLKTGKGSWKVVNNGISISWAPASKTTEQWDLPIYTGNQTGKCMMQAGAFPLKAMKVPPQYIQQLVGRWNVRVDKWTWIYQFDAHGGVRWTDPFNNMTGKGSWTLTKDRVFISWAPESRTREEWNMPFDTKNQTGKCMMQAGTFLLKAEKI